ncbi:MAG: AbrB/MazE/SpoVT family DNA-binding domain-containing protein [Candidatus Woesearchaeota archaeon]|jgi:hypothetical protein
MVSVKMECVVKKWGNSVGVILPKAVVRELQLKPKDKIDINIEQGIKAKDIFGGLSNWKINAQRMKDESREDWG